MQTTKNIVQQYYDSFNQQDMKTFLNLLHENVVHDINQSHSETGKKVFATFMEKMNHCYQEKIKDLVIMANENGSHAAAEFIVEGVYMKTDQGLPEAKGQRYRLPCGAFFTIQDGKISRVTTYYNLNNWLKQVKG